VNDQIDQIEPADAAQALSEIGRRREQVIRRAAVPRWFWWAIAALSLAFAADTEFLHGALSWAGTALFIAGTLAVNGLQLRALFRAPPRDDMLAPGSIPRILATAAAFAAVVTGVTLATKLSLEATRVPHPGMIASAVCVAVFVPGGLALTRYHTAVQLRRPGGRG
jgi:hypothetical protein